MKIRNIVSIFVGDRARTGISNQFGRSTLADSQEP